MKVMCTIMYVKINNPKFENIHVDTTAISTIAAFDW